MDRFRTDKLKYKQEKKREKIITGGSLKNSVVQYVNNFGGYHLYFDDVRKLQLERYTSKFAKQLKHKLILAYKWRSKTQFPVVKTYSFQIINQNLINVTFDVRNEHCETRLSQFYDIPFNQMLYLMRQCLIGYERLCDKFGMFNITNNMIGINQKQNCKVWLSENFDNNIPQYLDCDQKQFIIKLINMIEQKTIKTQQSKQFFKQMLIRQSFLDGLKFIEEFTNYFKIKTPKKFTISSKIIATEILKRKKNLNSFNPHKTFSPGYKLLINDLSYHNRGINSSIEKERKSVDQHQPIKTQKINESFNKKQIKSNMKYSNNTTKANTHLEPTKMSISNNFSIFFHDQAEEKKRNMQSPIKQQNIQNFAVCSDIALSNSDVKYRRNYSIQQILGKYGNVERQLNMQKNDEIPTSIQNIVQEEKQQSSKSEEDQEKQDFTQIIKKNGWEIKVNNILGDNCHSNMKKSVQIGQDQNKNNQDQKFHYLAPPGTTIYRSFIPNQL